MRVEKVGKVINVKEIKVGKETNYESKVGQRG